MSKIRIPIKSPLSVQQELTTECNLRCNHCYQLPLKRNVSIQKSDQLNKIFNSLIYHEIFGISLTGGEPLLIGESLYPFIRNLKTNNIYVSLNTNGTLLTQEVSHRLKEEGLDSILISILSDNPQIHDDITSVQGSHENTMQGIINALEAELNVGVNMVVTKENLNDILSLGRLLASLSISCVYATPRSHCYGFDGPLELDEEKIILKQLAELQDTFGLKVGSLQPIRGKQLTALRERIYCASCSAGKTTLAITPTGEIKPCAHSSEVIGSIFTENPFSDLDLHIEIGERSPRIDLTKKQRFTLNSEARFREENAGVLFFIPPREYVLLKKEYLYRLSTFLGEIFDQDQLNERLGIDKEETTTLLSILLNKNLIMEVKND